LRVKDSSSLMNLREDRSNTGGILQKGTPLPTKVGREESGFGWQTSEKTNVWGVHVTKIKAQKTS